MNFKTLHVTNSWHATSGGVATFYRELLAGAERAGREFRLVVPGDRDRVEEAGRYGRIYTIAGRRWYNKSPYRAILPAAYLRRRGALREIIGSERPHLAEVCDKYTL